MLTLSCLLSTHFLGSPYVLLAIRPKTGDRKAFIMYWQKASCILHWDVRLGRTRTGCLMPMFLAYTVEPREHARRDGGAVRRNVRLGCRVGSNTDWRFHADVFGSYSIV